MKISGGAQRRLMDAQRDAQRRLVAQRREGSRFIGQQLCRYLAGGSRELALNWNHPCRSEFALLNLENLLRRWVSDKPGTASGSRLSTPKAFGGCQPTDLPAYKAAPLQDMGADNRRLQALPFPTSDLGRPKTETRASLQPPLQRTPFSD